MMRFELFVLPLKKGNAKTATPMSITITPEYLAISFMCVYKIMFFDFVTQINIKSHKHGNNLR